MAKLGQLLVARGWISVQQLTRALQTQNSVGGRLGTCLLELDVLGEDLLARSLSEQLGVASASTDDLRGVPEEVLHLLPDKLARRCRAVPFRVLGGRLDVAMQDPRNLAAQDEIAFASGRRVKVHVIPEVRMYEALEKHYGEECPKRYGVLLDRLNRARYLWERQHPEAMVPVEPTVPVLRMDDIFAGAPTLQPPPLPEPSIPPTPRGRVNRPASPTSILMPLAELDLRALPQRGQPPRALPPLHPPPPATPPPQGRALEDTHPVLRHATMAHEVSAHETLPPPEAPAPEAPPAAPDPVVEEAVAAAPAAATAPAPPLPDEAVGVISASGSREVVALTEDEKTLLGVAEEPEPVPPPVTTAAPEPTPAAPEPEPLAAAPPPPPPPISAPAPPEPPAVATAEEAAPHEPPATIEEVEAALAATEDREDIGRIVLSYLEREFRRVALFQVNRQKVSGWMAHGDGIDQQAFARFSVGFDQPSVFLNLRQGSGMHIGPLPAMPAHRELALTWGGGLPRDSVVLPVRLKQRLVTVVYADGGKGGSSTLDLGRMVRLMSATANAFGSCLMARRNSGT